MNNHNEKGFSLIELLLVVVVIGIIAALAIPSLQRARLAAENGSTFAAMRSLNSVQVTFFSQNSRFARLSELNAIQGNNFGTVVDPKLIRGRFTFEMNGPGGLNPSDADLRTEYGIAAIRDVPGEDTVYRYELTQSGEIERVLPGPMID